VKSVVRVLHLCREVRLKLRQQHRVFPLVFFINPAGILGKAPLVLYPLEQILAVGDAVRSLILAASSSLQRLGK